jgi:hypothetical protein
VLESTVASVPTPASIAVPENPGAASGLLRGLGVPEYDPVHSVLLDPKLTPGDTFAGVTADDVCTPGWSREHRHVTEEMRAQVYARYGYNYDQCQGLNRAVASKILRGRPLDSLGAWRK